MRLFEAIVDANHRALAGDAGAGLHPADFPDELPMVALTCIDVRLNHLLPQVLGVPEDQFIWLRNAGNILTGPLSSTMRSLALACAIKGGRSIVIIGHTDCAVARTTTMELIDRFRAIGIDRQRLPDNINEYFGTFASEQANVIKAVDFVRRSQVISPKIAVHGLMVDTGTGKVDWLVNGYQSLEMAGAQPMKAAAPLDRPSDVFPTAPAFNPVEFKLPEVRIGEVATHVEPSTQPPPLPQPPAIKLAARAPEAKPSGPPPRIPLPPPIKPRMQFRKGSK